MRSLFLGLVLIAACTDAKTNDVDSNDDSTADTDGVDPGDPGDPADPGDPGDPTTDRDNDGYSADVDCDDDDANVNPGAVEVAGNGVDDDCDAGTCVSQDFATTAADWELPDRWSLGRGSDRWSRLAANESCGNITEFRGDVPPQPYGFSAYTLLDLTADGAPDLVEMSHCGADDVGLTEWLVFENDGGRFASTATSWTLPERWFFGRGSDRWTEVGDTESCADASPGGEGPPDPGYGFSAYIVLDITGDGAPDLIEQSHCGRDDVGRTEWLVYENTGNGFATTATSWSLPARWFFETGSDRWDRSTRTESCNAGHAGGEGPPDPGYGYSAYDLVDITGDGAPDLVEQSHCGRDDVGLSHWLVYENTGSGFASTAVEWSLPARWHFGEGSDRWRESADTESCRDPFDGGKGPPDPGSGSSSYALVDLTGDGAPELVEQSRCDEDDVGLTEWAVYANTGSGFASTSTSWSLPDRWHRGGGSDRWRTSSGRESCGGSGTSAYELIDLNSDGSLDLVEFSHCATDAVGLGEWWAFMNNGSGFDSAATPWALPSRWRRGSGTDRWLSSGATESCGGAESSGYTAIDLSGDGSLDLVEVSHCGRDDVSLTHWSIFHGQCDL